ncbi:TBC1 domain family member 10B [Engraulis encrasicolus]|uniref:TBC1 domain family member 10B n=1 Tax=Engraulis encrasicolus TaxID=184585 RepID=UPI002FD5E09A
MRRRSSSSFNRTPLVKRRTSSVGFDEFGFALSKKKEQKLQHRSHDYSYPEPDALRVKQLCELLSYWNGSSFICRSQIERFIRMGIPSSLRGRVWKCLLNLDSYNGSHDFNYQTCLDEIRQPLVDLGLSEYSILSALSVSSQTPSLSSALAPAAPSLSPASAPAALGFCGEEVALFHHMALEIKKSFPTHRSLMGESPEAIEGQAKLFRVLTVYTKFNPQGYSQGMCCVAAVLLMHLSEEEAFWALAVLFREPKYLPELFDLSPERVQRQAAVFQQLLKHRRPALSQHLEECGVSGLQFALPWFLALFSGLPCWDSVLAIWDVIMLQGWAGVFRAALALVSVLEPCLMALTDHKAMLSLLLRVPVELSKHCVLAPVLWATEVQESDLKNMASLLLENDEDAEEPHKNSVSKLNCTSPPTTEPKVHKTEAKTPPALGAKDHTKDTTGCVAKNVFVRMLRTAQRYLVVVGQPGGHGKPCSTVTQPAKAKAKALPQTQSKAKRRSQGQGQKRLSLHSLSRKQKQAPKPTTTTSQDTEASAATEDCSGANLRRLKSGPAGSGAGAGRGGTRRRKSVHKAFKRSSLQLCPLSSSSSSPCSYTPYKALLRNQENYQPAPLTPAHYRMLPHDTQDGQSSGTMIRESQLI